MGYSRSGGSLKRSTGLMKLQHMRYVMDWKADLTAAQEEEAKRKRKEELDALEWIEIDACMALEGETSFWTWYNDDNNVPDQGLHKDRIALIQARIKELRNGQANKGN